MTATQRARHIHVLEAHGGLTDGRTGYVFKRLIILNGYDLLPDDLIERLSRQVQEEHRAAQRMHEANRRICGA